MSEIRLDCLNKELSKKYKPSAVVMSDDLCEVCGEIKPCVIRVRKPWERVKHFLGIRDRKISEDEYLEDEEDGAFPKQMDEIAEQEGEKYIALNDSLQNDPSDAVPEDVENRALEFIREQLS